MQHIAFGLQFYNLSPLLLEAMYENIMECLFVASRKQFKCNCITSAFVKKEIQCSQRIPRKTHSCEGKLLPQEVSSAVLQDWD